jgi:hypothetical protein
MTIPGFGSWAAASDAKAKAVANRIMVAPILLWMCMWVSPFSVSDVFAIERS